MGLDLAGRLPVFHILSNLRYCQKKKKQLSFSLTSLTGCVAAQMNPDVSCGPHSFCMLDDLKLELSTQVRF